MIADIFITTKASNRQRVEIFQRSLRSFRENTADYRLTLIDDTGDANGYHEGLIHRLGVESYLFHRIIVHKKNMGLGPSINEALGVISTEQMWERRQVQMGTMKDEDVPRFIVYLQDDLLYTNDWLPKLATMFMLNEKRYNIAFASGLECIEHQEGLQEIAPGVQIKKYIRAACMFARSETWLSMFPIDPFDPETGRLRAKPNDGMGSGVDWWFLRNHPQSAERTGRTCLVMPGLIQHAGFNSSTWLKRDLPESEQDKRIIERTIS